MASKLARFFILAQIVAAVAVASSFAAQNPNPKKSKKPTPAKSYSASRAHLRKAPTPGKPLTWEERKALHPSEVRLPPLPRPTPKPPRAKGIKTTPKSTEALALNPAIPSEQAKEGTFVLSKSTQAGKLLLTFESEDAKYSLDPSAPLTIQLVPDGALKIEPSMIGEWPKGAKQVIISYQGASRTRENVILGKAAYTSCTANKKCKKQKTPIAFRFR